MPKEMDIGELNRLYTEAESIDNFLFAEQRSNLLLVAGEHYTRRKRKFFVNRIRDSKSLTGDQKLRLTKNHIQKITDTYINNIITNAPGITIVPDIDTELQDQKSAELNLAVWNDAKQKHKLNAKIRNWCKDFVEIGEVCVKVLWDPEKGDLMGYEPIMRQLEVPEINPETGEVVTEVVAQDENGQPMVDKDKPVFSGDFIFDRVFGFNLLRAPEAKSMDEARFLIERKMVNTKELKEKYKGDEDKLKFIQKTDDETFLVFDGTKAGYNVNNEETLVKYYYFRPCMQYPNGYFYITAKDGILEEGELPYGIFPIVYNQFDAVQTSARGRSRIKQLRPFQIEANRCFSQIATHQITLGDDKLVTNAAGKIEHGGTLPGVRVVKVPGGGNLTVLPGRSGDQFLPYMQDVIKEMYNVAMLEDQYQDKNDPTTDPMVVLFRSLKQKKHFSIYIAKFEEFLVDVAELYLKMAKHYLPDDALIPAIGRREVINIPEFRTSEKLGYRIKVEPQSDDIETKMGKQMVLNHALQYVGGQMTPDSVGKVLKSMPFANVGDIFDDLTLDHENARNDMLQMERGEYPPVNPYDNHDYLIKKFANRMRQPDFQFLDPQVQQMYSQKLTEHEQFKVAALQEMKMMESEFIPTGGYLVKADFYVSNEEGKTKRAVLPDEAVKWLLERLEQQGLSQEELQGLPGGAQKDIATQYNQQGQASPNQGESNG